MGPDASLIARFEGDLDALSPPGERIGVAVSGGPDSLALLVLAAAARPGRIEAATVDHRLRAQSRAEAEAVGRACAGLGVPHAILDVEWEEKPTAAIQERARDARYALLATWLGERGLDALATGHHADDQAETLAMRLNRGSGVRGLAAMRPRAVVPGSVLPLLRPLLGWRRRELAEVCAAAGLEPVADESNSDERFERVRIRQALAGAEWLDAAALARSAGHLAAADEALEWAADAEWERAVTVGEDDIRYRAGAPHEIVRRIVVRALAALASEGRDQPFGGSELDRLIAALEAGRTATLKGVMCSGGTEWRFTRAPRRAG